MLGLRYITVYLLASAVTINILKPQEDMLTRLNRLQKTMDSLDEGRLESNNKRINAIMSELDALNTKKQLLNINDENLKKVATYFEISLFYFAYKK